MDDIAGRNLIFTHRDLRFDFSIAPLLVTKQTKFYR